MNKDCKVLKYNLLNFCSVTGNRTRDTRIFSPNFIILYIVDILYIIKIFTWTVKTFWKTESVFLVTLKYLVLIFLLYFQASFSLPL